MFFCSSWNHSEMMEARVKVRCGAKVYQRVLNPVLCLPCYLPLYTICVRQNEMVLSGLHTIKNRNYINSVNIILTHVSNQSMKTENDSNERR